MKNNKWITYTLIIVLTLIVLGAVGFFAFRLGAAQGAAAITGGSVPFARGFGMGFEHGNMHNFGGRGGHMGRGGFGFLPFFGLGRLLVYGVLIWIGYKLFQNSGWKLVKESTPAASEPKSN